MLVLDLIDAKNKDLAWRLYLVRKDFRKGFESYTPSAKQIEQKKRSGRTRGQNQNECNEPVGGMDTTAFPGWWRE
jgi:hypothetical protein